MIDAMRRALADFINYRYLHGICLVTIALSVFIVSAFGLFLINARELMHVWQQGIRIIAYLEADVDSEKRAVLVKTIEQYPGVDQVDYISREAAFDWLKNEIGRQSSLLEGLSENPLPDALEIRLNDTLDQAKSIDGLANRIAGLESVSEVEYAQRWLHRFAGIYNLFRLTGLVLIGLICIAIVMIVANTIRLILYSRREEIEITRIIGADEAFIKYPLFMEGALLGILGGAIGMVLLYGAFSVTVPRMTSTGLLPFFELRFIPVFLTIKILMTSMLVGWLGCYFSIRRFLSI